MGFDELGTTGIVEKVKTLRFLRLVFFVAETATRRRTESEVNRVENYENRRARDDWNR